MMMHSISNGSSSLDQLLHLPETIMESLVFPASASPSSSRRHDMTHHHHHPHETKGLTSTTIPAVDILETPKDYRFFMDVPGFSKTDIQVTVEDDKTLVIRSNMEDKKKLESNGKSAEQDEEGGGRGNTNAKTGKRKRESSGQGADDCCKYIRLERPTTNKSSFIRKFLLPESCNVSAITAKCEDGVLTVTVEKLPPPPKPKTVQVAIS